MSNDRDALMLDSMGPSAKGGIEIRTHAGGPETASTLLFMADSMRSMLEEYDAPNYLEMEVKASDGKNYIMTLQRAGRLTPHQARVKAEEALEAAKPRQVSTVEELDALLKGDANVIVMDEDESPFQNLAGGWSPIHASFFWTSFQLHRACGPNFTVLHEGASE